MRIPIRLLGALVPVITVLAMVSRALTPIAAELAKVFKAGAGSPVVQRQRTLIIRGRTYRLGVGGVDYGLVFGGSKTTLHGRVSDIGARPTLRASMAQPARGLRSAAAHGLSFSLIKTVRFWSSRLADRADGERRSERVGNHDKIAGPGK